MKYEYELDDIRVNMSPNANAFHPFQKHTNAIYRLITVFKWYTTVKYRVQRSTALYYIPSIRVVESSHYDTTLPVQYQSAID